MCLESERAKGSRESNFRRRDLSFMVGSWVDDPEVDEALEDQRRIEPEPWS